MRVFMYVCMYIGMYVCVSVCRNARMYVLCVRIVTEQ